MNVCNNVCICVTVNGNMNNNIYRGIGGKENALRRDCHAENYGGLDLIGNIFY